MGDRGPLPPGKRDRRAESDTHQPGGSGAGGGFSSLAAQAESAPSYPARQDGNVSFGRIRGGRAQFSASKSRQKVAGHRLMGSSSISLGLDPCAPGSPTVEILALVCPKQLFKVRLAPYVGAASALRVAGSPERPTHTHSLIWPPGSADARWKLCAALRAAPGTRPRCSRTAPPWAALPAADCSEASEERLGGAAATFSSPPLAWVRRAAGARLAAHQHPPPRRTSRSWSAG